MIGFEMCNHDATTFTKMVAKELLKCLEQGCYVGQICFGYSQVRGYTATFKLYDDEEVDVIQAEKEAV